MHNKLGGVLFTNLIQFKGVPRKKKYYHHRYGVINSNKTKKNRGNKSSDKQEISNIFFELFY